MNTIEQLKQKPILVGVIIAGTLVSVGLLAWGISQSMPAKSQTANVKAAPQPAQQIVGLGRLEPAGGIIKLSAPLALDGDRIKELRVEEGSKIRAGQIIAVLDSVDRLQATLIHERQQVAIAQAKLAQIKAGAKSGEIVAQRATISRTQVQIEGEQNTQQKAIGRIKAQWEGDRAAQLETIARIRAQWDGDKAAQSAAIGKFQIELTNARSELNRYQQLAQQGAISQSLLDSKKLAVASFGQQLQEAEAIHTRIENTSSKQLKEAQTVLARIQSTNRQQLQEADATLAKIQGTGKGQVVEAQANLTRIAEIRPVDIQAAQAEVQSAIAAQN
jgi:HlyD family secretion protein